MRLGAPLGASILELSCESYNCGVAIKKNAAAVALVKLRNKKLSAERRQEIASIAGKSRVEKISPERRKEIAEKAAAKRWGKKA